MNIFKRITHKRHWVSFCGRFFRIGVPRFKKMKCSPQEYVDRNVVVCGCCGEIMFPGEKIWLVTPITDEEAAKPGVLVIGEGRERALVGCLSWNCPPTAAVMCGDLLEGRQVRFFQSPLSKAFNSGETVMIPSVQDYEG